MYLTFEVSHEDRSALKELASLNISCTLLQKRKNNTTWLQIINSFSKISPHKSKHYEPASFMFMNKCTSNSFPLITYKHVTNIFNIERELTLIDFTFEVSHKDRSVLKERAPQNINCTLFQKVKTKKTTWLKIINSISKKSPHKSKHTRQHCSCS